MSNSWYKCEKCGHEAQILVNPNGPPAYCRECGGKMVKK